MTSCGSRTRTRAASRSCLSPDTGLQHGSRRGAPASRVWCTTLDNVGVIERADADAVLAPADIRRRAREALGHRRLLPGQAEAVGSIVAGHDTLVLLPTGGGKSAIYQLAGIERTGTTLLVSPLLALQHHQIAGPGGLGLPARLLTSTISAPEREQTLPEFERGAIESPLPPPERLASAAVLERVSRAEPTLLVVDE